MNYIDDFSDLDEPEDDGYGIKGMKWGIRNYVIPDILNRIGMWFIYMRKKLFHKQ